MSEFELSGAERANDVNHQRRVEQLLADILKLLKDISEQLAEPSE